MAKYQVSLGVERKGEWLGRQADWIGGAKLEAMIDITVNADSEREACTAAETLVTRFFTDGFGEVWVNGAKEVES